MKNKIIALFLAAALLLSGCAAEKESRYSLDEITQTLDAALEDGHFFFCGKVLSAGTSQKMISYYDAESTSNAVYQVQVTEDFFGCMPEDPITVCVFGSSSNFNNRAPLEKGKEYLFDTTLWVQGESLIYLLPTFYESMPQKDGGSLYYQKGGAFAPVKGGYEGYKEHLLAKASTVGYGPNQVWAQMEQMAKSASLKDAAYFQEQKFEQVDGEFLLQTVTAAKALYQRLEQNKNNCSWEQIGKELSL